MSNVSLFPDAITDPILELVEQSQQATLRVVEGWAGLIVENMPRADSYSSYLEPLANSGDTTGDVFDFTGDLLTAQREFVTSLIGAITPVTQATRRAIADTTSAATEVIAESNTSGDAKSPTASRNASVSTATPRARTSTSTSSPRKTSGTTSQRAPAKSSARTETAKSTPATKRPRQ